jgi:cellulose synthase (UDP-forming)
MNDLHIWAPLLVTTGLLVLIFQCLPPQLKYARVLSAIICIVVSARYLYWRALFTFPSQQNIVQQVWAGCFLCMELCTVLSSMLVCFFLSRHIDRSPDADARRSSALHQAPVDVLIATYNESYEVVERTIVGALAIDHPDLRVWVLDDGARPWLRELAKELGVMYAWRVNGAHAKAGNVNHGFQQALTTGRRPEFLLLLDADFVPSRKILKRVLGLFEEEDVGIVQTPQHFFNHDPVQSNLVCSSVWPDEQRFFFNVLMPCKDAWGAAFCCGTSAVFRVSALERCGGMRTETVTEDMLTSFSMREFGYRTIYLNERLSIGLSPESLKEFMGQRSRWCLGAVQQLYTRWSFFGRARIGWINRVAFFDSILYWFSASFKLMLITAPMLYWLTATSVIRATVPELLFWMAPAVAANLIFTRCISANRVLPVMTDLNQLLTVFVVCRTVVIGLVRPFGHSFKVTAKGISTTGTTVQWAMLWRFALLAFLTALGMALHFASFSPGHGAQGYTLNVVWSLLNIAMLALACAVCIEPPKRRREERFTTDEEGLIRTANGIELPCRLRDLSTSGASVFREQGWTDLDGPATLVLDHGRLALPFDVVRSSRQQVGLKFHADARIRRALIVKIFTGDYHHDIEEVRAPDVFRSLVRVLAG